VPHLIAVSAVRWNADFLITLRHSYALSGVVLSRLFSAILLCGLYPSYLMANELEELVMDSKKLIANYEFRLQTAYDDAYDLKDPSAIEEVCKKASTTFATGLTKGKWRIGRTSLDVLNRDNAPDHVEQNILKNFSDKLNDGAETERLSWYKLTEIANHSEFRYIKAFEMEQRCMSCHKGQSTTSGTQNTFAVYTLKKIETKNYFPEEAFSEPADPLPLYEE
jgi:hypothetical protein